MKKNYRYQKKDDYYEDEELEYEKKSNQPFPNNSKKSKLNINSSNFYHNDPSDQKNDAYQKNPNNTEKNVKDKYYDDIEEDYYQKKNNDYYYQKSEYKQNNKKDNYYQKNDNSQYKQNDNKKDNYYQKNDNLQYKQNDNKKDNYYQKNDDKKYNKKDNNKNDNDYQKNDDTKYKQNLNNNNKDNYYQKNDNSQYKQNDNKKDNSQYKQNDNKKDKYYQKNDDKEYNKKDSYYQNNEGEPKNKNNQNYQKNEKTQYKQNNKKDNYYQKNENEAKNKYNQYNPKNENKNNVEESQKNYPPVEEKRNIKKTEIDKLSKEFSILNRYKSFVESDRKKPHIQKVKLGKKLKILMVAEKPSIAKDIYSALSGGKPESSKGKNLTLKYSGYFFNHPGDFLVTSVKGHVFSRDFQKQYSNWERTDPLELFDCDTIKNDCDPGSGTVRHLQSLAQDVDVVLLWLDNDREGENISFEILDCIWEKMKVNDFKQIYRVRFSSLVKKDLVNAFQNVFEGPNINEALAVESRQIFDLKIGVAFTRFMTLKLKNEFAKFKDKLVSYGPCQIPTLALVVQRQKEIKNFQPQKYFKLNFQLSFDSRPDMKSIDVGLKGLSNRFWTKEDAQNFYNSIKTKGYLKDVKIRQTKKVRPKGLNTVNMLKFVTKYLGMSSHSAMHVAESLYLSGYLTYPRTESTHYPKDFNFKSILQSLGKGNDASLKRFSSELLAKGYNKPPKGTDAGDHPPIAPTEKTPTELSADQSKIYNFVCSNFLQSISEDAVLEKTEYLFEMGEHLFCFENSRLLTKGYLEVKGKSTEDENFLGAFVPEAREKAQLKILIKEAFTTPPQVLTESELLGKMESFSIGTDASMAIHIKNIIERDYVQVNSNQRELTATDLGWTLVESLYEIDPEIVEPTLRGKVEQKMNLIANGSLEFVEVTKEILDIFKIKFIYFNNNFDKLVNNLKKYYKSSEEVIKNGKNFGRCGKCKRYMSFADSIKKITCTNCKDWVLDLPNTVIHLANDEICEDSYNLLKYKIELGISEKEEKQLFDYEDPQRKDLIAKAKGFAVYLKLCPHCAFEAKEKNEYYEGIPKFVHKCDFCFKDTFLTHEKTLDTYYQLCLDKSCRNLNQLLNDVKTLKEIKNENCDKCKEILFDVVFKNGKQFKKCCLFCEEELKLYLKKLGRHNMFDRFKKFGSKKGKFNKGGKHKKDGNNNTKKNK